VKVVVIPKKRQKKSTIRKHSWSIDNIVRCIMINFKMRVFGDFQKISCPIGPKKFQQNKPCRIPWKNFN